MNSVVKGKGEEIMSLPSLSDGDHLFLALALCDQIGLATLVVGAELFVFGNKTVSVGGIHDILRFIGKEGSAGCASI